MERTREQETEKKRSCVREKRKQIWLLRKRQVTAPTHKPKRGCRTWIQKQTRGAATSPQLPKGDQGQ